MMMRINLLLIISLFLSSTSSFADYDAALEGREEAERVAARQESQAQDREIAKMKANAMSQFNKEAIAEKRKTLGAQALGKSDAAVEVLYQQKIAADIASGMDVAAQARAALSSGAGADAVKQVTGKSLSELENMSDAEAEALAAEMQKKYGQ